MKSNLTIFKESVVDSLSRENWKLVGDSMAPVFRRDTMIGMERLQYPLQKGKCYVFKGNERFVAHRLITTEKENAYLIGDNGESIDKVRVEDVVGEVPDGLGIIRRSIVAWVNILFYYCDLILGEYRPQKLRFNRTKDFGVSCQSKKRVYYSVYGNFLESNRTHVRKYGFTSKFSLKRKSMKLRRYIIQFMLRLQWRRHERTV